jgi:hypothetical protein
MKIQVWSHANKKYAVPYVADTVTATYVAPKHKNGSFLRFHGNIFSLCLSFRCQNCSSTITPMTPAVRTAITLRYVTVACLVDTSPQSKQILLYMK